MYLPFAGKSGTVSFWTTAAFAGVLSAWLYLPVRAERLPVKTYTVADGLLRDGVSKIRQDSRGFLWFCTAEGISRFDGVGMTNFTVADGLPDRWVEDFLETKSGTIYLATGNGLARLNPWGLRVSTQHPLFTTFVPGDPKARSILTLYQDRAGRVLAGTSDGLYEVTETGDQVALRLVPLGPPLHGVEVNSDAVYVTTILEDRHGTLWVGTQGSGLYRRSKDGVLKHYTTADRLGDNKVTGLLEDQAGQLWVSFRGGRFGGLCRLDSANFNDPVQRCYFQKDGLPSNWVQSLLETSDGRLWIASVTGLCLWQGEGKASVCKTYDAKNDLCEGIDSLLEDSDGNVWTGSPCGAKKIARYGFTTYGSGDGLDHPKVNSIFQNARGDLFVSTQGGKRAISRFDGDKFLLARPRIPAVVDNWGWGWQQTVWQDRAGAWWIPTGEGLFRSANQMPFQDLSQAPLEVVQNNPDAPETFRLFEDSRGDVWTVATGLATKLWRWERATGVWHDHSQQVNFTPYRIGSAFVEDHSGNIWIGASSDRDQSALIRYRDGVFHVFTAPEGAPSGWYRDLFVDGRGRLWIASNNDGLWRLDDPNAANYSFAKYSTANGLASNSTTSITEDAYGRIYVGTWRGVDRLNPDTGQVEHFTTADGLPGSLVENSLRDRNNDLWFGTHEGVARFVPEPKRERHRPTMLIMGLSVGGEPQSVSIMGATSLPELSLTPSQRQVSVDFLGLGASPGEKLRYEYRLGAGAWTPTNERTVNFANLSSGSYRFEVRAVTADQIFSEPAAFSFKVAAPYYLRIWFFVLVGLIVAGLVLLIYRYRVARLLEMERVRTRIATDLHDDIGANLSKISILSELAQRQMVNRAGSTEDGNLLEKIAETSRESVSAMSDIVWAINPKKDSLVDLAGRMRRQAQETLGRCDIALEFNATPAVNDVHLSADLRRNIYLIFKEALNNCIRHADATRVRIELNAGPASLTLIIRDNGRGFDATAESEGNGLASMERRAIEMGGTFQLTSRPNQGTSVSLAVKLGRNAWK